MGTDIFNVFQIIVGGSSFHLITFHSDSHLGPVSYDYPIIYVEYCICSPLYFYFQVLW